MFDLNKPYDRKEFNGFLDEFLPEDYEKTDESLPINPNLIESVICSGKIPSLDNLKIYEIKHQSEYDPRVTLTKEVCRLMANHGVRKALAVFLSKKSDNYRFSLITIELELIGRRVTREYSNPRRYSFYLGPDAKTHTPEAFLIRQGKIKDIDDLKKRFSIEVVNKDFYMRIAELFTKLTGGTRGIGGKSIDAREGSLKLPSTRNDFMRKEFAAELIGRLVFCWFLKKKQSVKGVPLLSEHLLSSTAIQSNREYYHSLLEPLFFEVLNVPIENRKKKYKGNSWDTIPFLNGGLFSPHAHDFYEPGTLGVSKNINTLKVPDKWLKELFEMFEMYNFTIDENSSVDIELSVDPEMLGRIFENLLAEINPETGETARKSTGSYYTPRPIVEYMVDESLKQYLLTKTILKEETISKLLAYNDTEIGLKEAQEKSVIDALDSIKIIDPACGSGAFPMGVLQKILLILQKVDPSSQLWFDKKLAPIGDVALRKDLKSKLRAANFNYIHKLGIIRDTIYGVDIQPIAVEISKLRFFLSLIVDESVDDTKENRGIEPLPNLEFKFVCANSLIGLPKTIETIKVKGMVGNLFEATYDIKQLKSLRDEYLRSCGDEKEKIEKKFQDTQGRMFKHSMSMGGKDSQTLKLSQWDPFSEEACSWFDPEWMFGVSDGFDIVIANPPYVEHKKLKLISRQLKDFYKVFSGRGDLYIYFYERSLNLLKKNGILTFISSNKYFRTSYGQKLRIELSNYQIESLIDFTNVKLFDALVATCVIVLKKSLWAKNAAASLLNDNNIDINNLTDSIHKNSFPYDFKSNSGNIWSMRNSDLMKIKMKIETDTEILSRIKGVNISRGITTGCNNAFIISGQVRSDLIAKESKSRDIIKPLLQGRNIKKWRYDYTDSWIIIVKYGFNQRLKDYPAILNHLRKYEKELKVRGQCSYSRKGKMEGQHHWLELDNNPKDVYLKYFNDEKIIWGLTADKWAFAYDDKGYYIPSNGYILTSEDIPIKYLIAIINSRLMEYYFSFIGIMTAGGAYTLKHETISEFPIKEKSKTDQKPFIDIVDKILAITKTKDYYGNSVKQEKVRECEKQIDQLVYKLYGLTKEEIGVVEGEK